MSDQLDAQIAAALERLAHARRVLQQAFATDNGLSPLQVEILLVLHSTPTFQRSSQLAQVLGVSAATVSDAVAALQRKGHVVNDIDDLDGRRRRVTATATGVQLAEHFDAAQLAITAPLHDLEHNVKVATLGTLLHLINDLHRTGVITIDRSCTTCRHFVRNGADTGPRCDLLCIDLEPALLRARCPEHQLR